MPRNVNPASITVGAGIAPQGTVEDNSLRHPQRDTEPLRAHLLDPNNAHMAAAIGIVDAGGYYASTDVEGALQEIGAGSSAGRQNGLVLGGTFTSGPGLLTLDTPTVVLIGGVAASFGGATVVLPPSVTRYVWVDPSTSTLTASAVLPSVSSEPILIAKVATDAGANITSSQDARFFVANLDRKVDYTLRSDGSAVNDASEACFVTLDAALFWLENYVATSQERKALVLVRGEHVINSTVKVPSGVPNIEFRGEGAATFATGASLNPMFNVSGTAGLTFTGLTFRCDHPNSVAIRTATGALPCSDVTVQNCRFTVGGSTWGAGVALNAATPAIQQGHRVLNSQMNVSSNGVLISSAVDCVVRDCTLTGTGTVVGSVGVLLSRNVPNGENCVVENVKVVGGFSFPFMLSTDTSTLRDSQASGGGSSVDGVGCVVDGCTFSDITDTTAGLTIGNAATHTVVSNTSVTTTTVWAPGDDPAGIRVTGSTVTVSDCTVSGFSNAPNLGAGLRFVGNTGHKVSKTTITTCNTGIELLGATESTVEGCLVNALIRGIVSSTTSSGTKVANTTVGLSGAAGVAGIVIGGATPTVVGCRVSTARAFNTYAVGDVPAGILCGVNAVNGPYTITGCTLTNFYDSVGQVGGGVVYKGGVDGLTVSGCTFTNCGVFGDNAASLVNARVTECLFETATLNLQRVGVSFVAVNDVLDTNVSDCTFTFTSTSTTNAVEVSGGTVARCVVADCTYTAAGAPGGAQRFVEIAASVTGSGVVVEGNTVRYPSVSSLGPMEVLGVDTLLVGNNSFLSDSASVSVVLSTNAKQVDYTGNTVINMNGIDLVAINGFVPTLHVTGSTFDGGNDTGARGIRVVPFNAALSMEGLVITGSTFRAVLDGVRLTNPLNNLSLSDCVISDNQFGSCQNGVQFGDILQTKGLNVSGNHFSVYNYAFLYNNGGTGSVSLLNFSENTVVQSNFVGVPTADALCYVQVETLTDVSVLDNTFSHVGDVGAVSLYGTNASGVRVDGNSTTSTAAAAFRPITVSLFPTAPLTLGLSVSRNRVTHLANGSGAILLNVNMASPNNTVSEVRMDGNDVFTVPGAFVTDVGVNCSLGSAVLANRPFVRAVSLCHNTVRTSGEAVLLDTTNPQQVQDVQICHNTSLGPTDVSAKGAIVATLAYTGFPPPAPPATAFASNFTVSHNTVRKCEASAGVYVFSRIPMSNLSVDDNALWDIGTVAGMTLGNVYVYLSNDAGAPNYNVATNVSVSRNKIAPSDATAVNYAAYAIFLSSDAGVNSTGMNLAIDGNEIAYHNGGGIGVSLDYDLIENLSVSGNKVNSVNGQAIVVEKATSIKGLNVSDNLVEKALLAGGAAGYGTIEVWSDDGDGFVFSGNRIGTASRKGIFVNGSSATSTLDHVTFTGNTVSFAGGAGAAEEGLYVYWERGVYDVAVAGNTVNNAETGIFIDGGLNSSLLLTVSEVRRVSVTGNTVTASNYGVWVSNHTTNSGLGTANLTDVTVTGNTITSVTSGGAMLYGVLVDQVFGTMSRVTVAHNTASAGTASTGSIITVDGNDADLNKVSIHGNSVENGDVGVQVAASTTKFYDVSVTGNRVSDLGQIGIYLTGMKGIRNMVVDGNYVNTVTTLPFTFTGQGILVNSTTLSDNTYNLSVSNNHVYSTQGQGILVNLLRSAGNISARNLKIRGNEVVEWNQSTTYALNTPAIQLSTCTAVGDPHPLYNLDVSNNSCMNISDDWVSGFVFSLDESSRQFVFAHNQVLLDNQANAGAMSWTFINTGFDVPKDFTFTGNQFRNTNGAVPSYTGATGNFAVFQGNIGSAANFWTTFATNWTNYLPATINNQNFDNGT